MATARRSEGGPAGGRRPARCGQRRRRCIAGHHGALEIAAQIMAEGGADESLQGAPVACCGGGRRVGQTVCGEVRADALQVVRTSRRRRGWARYNTMPCALREWLQRRSGMTPALAAKTRSGSPASVLPPTALQRPRPPTGGHRRGRVAPLTAVPRAAGPARQRRPFPRRLGPDRLEGVPLRGCRSDHVLDRLGDRLRGTLDVCCARAHHFDRLVVARPVSAIGQGTADDGHDHRVGPRGKHRGTGRARRSTRRTAAPECRQTDSPSRRRGPGCPARAARGTPGEDCAMG